jgi:hypothetical protein
MDSDDGILVERAEDRACATVGDSTAVPPMPAAALNLVASLAHFAHGSRSSVT